MRLNGSDAQSAQRWRLMQAEELIRRASEDALTKIRALAAKHGIGIAVDNASFTELRLILWRLEQLDLIVDEDG